MISLPKKAKKTLYVYLNKTPNTAPAHILVFSFIELPDIENYQLLQTEVAEVEICAESRIQITNYINKAIFN